MEPTQMTHEVGTFNNWAPFTVTIDESEELTKLLSQAEKCQGMPFDEKLTAIKSIALQAMQNAYEVWQRGEQTPLMFTCSQIVCNTQTLGFALQNKAGCCRYQATLFFLLGAAAKLGDKHYLQSTQINDRLNTCYNDVIHNGKVHHVSIFTESLEDKKYDYSAHLGSKVFENPIVRDPRTCFLAYTVDCDGTLHQYATEGRHFDFTPPSKKSSSTPPPIIWPSSTPEKPKEDLTYRTIGIAFIGISLASLCYLGLKR